MKKVLLTAMALLTIASASVFGMYGDRDSWIDFLVHGNQLRARMDQFGFVLGNGTIKGTFGFRSQAASTALGNILTTGATGDVNLTSTISAGIGYTSEPFGIGLGYNYTFINNKLGVHTPVLMINALNNNLRIAVPLQIAVTDNPFGSLLPQTYNVSDYLGISTDVQIRYYTGIDAFNAIRIYFKYGQSGFKVSDPTGVAPNSEAFAQSVGFEARFYFLNTPVGNVTINPFVKVAYNTALYGSARQVRAGDIVYNAINNGQLVWGDKDVKWEKNPYDVTAQVVLGITANSDIVSLYVEPSLGYKALYTGKAQNAVDSKVQHGLAWGAYTELYVRPVQDLEWYFEMNVNNDGYGNPSQAYNLPVYFETTTGITWYLPAFN
ncbi:variable surface family protein [Brachyspira hampsonii]|uniref:Cell surface protein n=1 Tax=Brachyspira hampsonii TaxID=1287055 RepID=A0AAC9TU35_9SPIR|nr:variable surface family protein [Brachyspira hampsonii]ASJ21262.1 cell surface protein [Brachyspira hampsonii]ELV05683.1 variable surface protein VspF [Brachyspira hampsonii 30599]OEJ19612.1 cell surface protein [Brachyspira hampsonii]